jgi:hypothetical protein
MEGIETIGRSGHGSDVTGKKSQRGDPLGSDRKRGLGTRRHGKIEGGFGKENGAIGTREAAARGRIAYQAAGEVERDRDRTFPDHGGTAGRHGYRRRDRTDFLPGSDRERERRKEIEDEHLQLR